MDQCYYFPPRVELNPRRALSNRLLRIYASFLNADHVQANRNIRQRIANGLQIMPPRIGGDQGGTDFCGGTQSSNTVISALARPKDVLGFRPAGFHECQRQMEQLKQGLPEAFHLELPVDNKLKTPLMVWMEQLKFHIELRGMEPVFCVRKTIGTRYIYLNLFTDFGKITADQIQAHITDYESRNTGTVYRDAAGNDVAGYDFFDQHDRENLHLSGIVIRSSLGPNLAQRVSSLCPMNAPGPVVFKHAIDQVMFMNATTIRNLSNELGGLTLSKIPGENVAELTLKVTELARELVGSGSPPTDLMNLISKPYTKGTVQAFQTHALQIHTQVMLGTYGNTWEQMVAQHNLMYQDLVQSGEYPPATGKKDQDDSIQGLLAKIDKLTKIVNNNGNNGKKSGGGSSNNNNNNNNNNKRTCYECGSEDHLVKDCPKKKKDKKNWRHVPPNSKKGEGKTKTVDGTTYKWCGKCRRNKGWWTSGDKLHSTEEHKSKKDQETPKKKESQEEGNLGYVDGPLEFGFCSIIYEDNCKCSQSKGFCGDC